MTNPPFSFPEIKNNFQFFVGLILILFANYCVYKLAVFLYKNFEIFQTENNEILILIFPLCMLLALILEVSTLYESKKRYLLRKKREKSEIN